MSTPAHSTLVAGRRRGAVKTWIVRRWCRQAGIELDHLDAILVRAVRGEASTLDCIHLADVLRSPRT